MSDHDDLPMELLAGLADGELSPRDRARVETWLAEHPEAREVLDEQESLGRGNTELWRLVQPPVPGPAEWGMVRSGLHAQLARPAMPNRGWTKRFAAAILAVAACLTIGFVISDRPEPTLVAVTELPALCPPFDPDDEPFAIARADEVRYLSLPESAAPLIRVGRHPMDDAMFVLARVDEVEFHGLGSDPEGRFPAPPMAANPPMIWAPRAP